MTTEAENDCFAVVGSESACSISTSIDAVYFYSKPSTCEAFRDNSTIKNAIALCKSVAVQAQRVRSPRCMLTKEAHQAQRVRSPRCMLTKEAHHNTQIGLKGPD